VNLIMLSSSRIRIRVLFRGSEPESFVVSRSSDPEKTDDIFNFLKSVWYICKLRIHSYVWRESGIFEKYSQLDHYSQCKKCLNHFKLSLYVRSGFWATIYFKYHGLNLDEDLQSNDCDNLPCHLKVLHDYCPRIHILHCSSACIFIVSSKLYLFQVK